METVFTVSSSPCRLCASTNNKCIDVLKCKNAFEMNVVEEVRNFLSIEIVEGDGFSSVICQSCISKLEDFHKFRTHVQTSQRPLRTWESVSQELPSRPANEKAPQVCESNDASPEERTEKNVTAKEKAPEVCMSKDPSPEEVTGKVTSEKKVPQDITFPLSSSKSFSNENSSKKEHENGNALLEIAPENLHLHSQDLSNDKKGEAEMCEKSGTPELQEYTHENIILNPSLLATLNERELSILEKLAYVSIDELPLEEFEDLDLGCSSDDDQYEGGVVDQNHCGDGEVHKQHDNEHSLKLAYEKAPQVCVTKDPSPEEVTGKHVTPEENSSDMCMSKDSSPEETTGKHTTPEENSSDMCMSEDPSPEETTGKHATPEENSSDMCMSEDPSPEETTGKHVTPEEFMEQCGPLEGSAGNACATERSTNQHTVPKKSASRHATRKRPASNSVRSQRCSQRTVTRRQSTCTNVTPRQTSSGVAPPKPSVKKDQTPGHGKNNNKPRFPCEVCHKDFATKSYVKEHLKIHSGVRDFICPVCQHRFRSKQMLKQHARVHTGERNFPCNICNKYFISKEVLNFHRKLHSNERNFICNKCQKRFKTRGPLKVHMRVHTGEKPYKCKLCFKAFADSGTFSAHMRRHSDRRPYECHDCGKTFKMKLYISNHVMIHINMRPFPCTKCERKFRTKAHLEKHVRCVHNKPVKPDAIKPPKKTKRSKVKRQ